MAVQFCLLAMSALIYEMRHTQRSYDQYTIVDDQQGHVTDDEILKLLRDEIGVRFAGKLIHLHVISTDNFGGPDRAVASVTLSCESV